MMFGGRSLVTTYLGNYPLSSSEHVGPFLRWSLCWRAVCGTSFFLASEAEAEADSGVGCAKIYVVCLSVRARERERRERGERGEGESVYVRVHRPLLQFQTAGETANLRHGLKNGRRFIIG